MTWYDKISLEVDKIDKWVRLVNAGKIIPEKAIYKQTLIKGPPKVANKPVTEHNNNKGNKRTSIYNPPYSQ